MTRRVHIDKLVLDLRGLPPTQAQDAARGLAPALERALRGAAPGPAPADALAARVLQQIQPVLGPARRRSGA